MYKSETLGRLYNVKYLVQDVFTLESVKEWDIIILAVDNVSCRMHLNYIYKLSSQGILIDCGVSKTMCNVLKVSSSSFCLYCIKEMYENLDRNPESCSSQAIDDNTIRPSVCFVNSICASLVLLMLNTSQNNYVLYNGTVSIFCKTMQIKKDEYCIICNMNKEAAE